MREKTFLQNGLYNFYGGKTRHSHFGGGLESESMEHASGGSDENIEFLRLKERCQANAKRSHYLQKVDKLSQ